MTHTHGGEFPDIHTVRRTRGETYAWFLADVRTDGRRDHILTHRVDSSDV